MLRKEQTTVNLTNEAQKIKEDLAPIFGLKNILSAGLLIFSKLSSDEQKQMIEKANENNEPVIKNKPQKLRDVIKNIVEKTKAKQDIPAMMIKVEPSDQNLWDELKKIAEIEPEKKAKKV